jgi:BMFP domain-containing protein YqiC
MQQYDIYQRGSNWEFKKMDGGDYYLVEEVDAALAEKEREIKDTCEADKKIAALIDQLPEGMKDCKIIFTECPVGHGFLRGLNWIEIEHDCPWCKIIALTAEVTTLKDERANAIRKRMKETLEWIFEGEFEAGTLADLLARSREENAVLQARIKELEDLVPFDLTQEVTAQEGV